MGNYFPWERTYCFQTLFRENFLEKAEGALQISAGCQVKVNEYANCMINNTTVKMFSKSQPKK